MLQENYILKEIENNNEFVTDQRDCEDGLTGVQAGTASDSWSEVCRNCPMYENCLFMGAVICQLKS